MPLDDRKSVRLTCSRFYDLCNDKYIQSKEVITFNGYINTVPAILSLSDVYRKSWTIKLSSVHVTDDSILSLFEKQGTNVRSLIFHECQFTPGLFKSIIEHCIELCNIALIFSTENSSVEYVLNDFKALESSSISRPSVIDFSLKMPIDNDEIVITNLKFLRFFTVFPSIKRLDLEIGISSIFNQFSTISADIRSDTVFSFSSVYSQLLVMSNQLQKLRLKFVNYRSFAYSGLSVESLIKISNIDLKNLEEFSLSWINLERNVSVMHALMELKNLTHFECDFKYRLPTDGLFSKFLQLLLNTSHSLYSLKFKYIKFRMDCDLFQVLVKSKLKTLSIDNVRTTEFFVEFEPSALENTLLPNYNLENLYCNNLLEHNSKLIFHTYFRSLKSIEFPEVDECVLQNIFEYQTKIHHLRLFNTRTRPVGGGVFKELSTFQRWLEKKETTIKRELKYLIHLHIWEDEYCLTNFMLSEFLFPSLKSLSIGVSLPTDFNCEQFWQHLQESPWLQYLRLDLPVNVSFQHWLTLFSNLSKLRYFHIKDSRTELLHDVEYRRLFDVCPSLRVIEHYTTKSFETCKYFYDITTKTVIDISRSWESASVTTHYRY